MRPLASRIYDAAGIARDDVDALLVQDATSLAVVEALELFGFCAPERRGRLPRRGAHALGGDLPVNTNGGQLSESYMWGCLHLCEAVRQLRGECGERQVAGAKVAQYCLVAGLPQVRRVDARDRAAVSDRPLPDLAHPLYGPHWAAAADERLAMQQCEACGYVRWPPSRSVRSA